MLKKRNIVAFIIIAVLGTLGHFVYDWTNKNFIVGLFFPVSESIWEHLKLLFYPALIYFTAEYFILKEKPQNYISAAVKGILCSMSFTVIFYYLYTGVIGRNIDFLNIAIFFVSVYVLLYKKEKMIESGKYSLSIFNVISLSLVVIIGILFALWSYNPPSLGIFMQPLVPAFT